VGRRRKESEDEMPPLRDKRWAAWSVPLLDYLGESPRTWDDLEKWRRAQRVSGFLLRNMLAWLEDRHRARSDGEGDTVTWRKL
jgi:hypothetical protein